MRQRPIGKLRRAAVGASSRDANPKKRLSLSDVSVKFASIATVVVSALWGLYKWYGAGGHDWTVNLELSTEVLPYESATRLLVVGVKSENPLDHSIEFQKPNGSFKVVLHGVPPHLASGTVLTGDEGAEISRVDLLPDDGYIFLPHSKFEDSSVFVVPAAATISVVATLSDQSSEISVHKTVTVDH